MISEDQAMTSSVTWRNNDKAFRPLYFTWQDSHDTVAVLMIRIKNCPDIGFSIKNNDFPIDNI